MPTYSSTTKSTPTLRQAKIFVFVCSSALLFASVTSDNSGSSSAAAAEQITNTSQQVGSATVTSSPASAIAAPDIEHIGGRPRIALALGGGGTRGAAEIGVLRVLERNGIHVDAVAGTSMGALIGGLYLAGVPLDDLQSKFADRTLMKSFNSIPPYVRIAAVPFRTVKRALGLKSYDGLYKGNVFRRYIQKELPQCSQNIEDLKRPFAAIAFNLLDGATYAIKRGELARALEASCAIPVLRKPIQIDDKLFVDGGSIDNVPVDEARALGGDIVIAVNVDQTVNQVPADTFYKVGTVGPRMLNLELAIADSRHCKNADVVIHPEVNGIGITSTSKEDALRAIAAGEESAEQALPAIREKLKQAGVAAESGSGR